MWDVDSTDAVFEQFFSYSDEAGDLFLQTSRNTSVTRNSPIDTAVVRFASEFEEEL
jgi:hypothetical protein